MTTLHSIHVHQAHSFRVKSKIKISWFPTHSVRLINFPSFNMEDAYRWYFIEHGILLIFVERNEKYSNTDHHKETAYNAHIFVNVYVIRRWNCCYVNKMIWCLSKLQIAAHWSLYILFSSRFGGFVVVGIHLYLELHMCPVQQQKFIFFVVDVSTHSALLQALSVKHPFILTCDSPESIRKIRNN